MERRGHRLMTVVHGGEQGPAVTRRMAILARPPSAPPGSEDAEDQLRMAVPSGDLAPRSVRSHVVRDPPADGVDRHRRECLIAA